MSTCAVPPKARARLSSARQRIVELSRRAALQIVARFWQIAVVGLCLAGNHTAWAQSRSRNSRRDEGGGIALDLNDWIPEVVMLIVVLILAFSLMFLVIFPFLLRRANPWWPMNAYGVCLTGAFTICCALGLWIFWEDLILRPTQGNGPVGPFNAYALRGAVALGWFFISSILLSVFRSSRGRSAAR